MNSAWVLPAAFAAGFFGSSHCVGMCGGLIVLLEGAGGQQGATAWIRRLVYNVGRLGFYTLLGVVAAGGGAVLTKATGVNIGLLLLRGLAALLVIAIGVNLVFGWSMTRSLERMGSSVWKLLAPLTRYVLPTSTIPRSLAAGFLWGALPCGLVYSTVALAATTGHTGQGAGVMVAFWLGTLPALFLLGGSAAQIKRWKSRPWVRWGAGSALVALGFWGLRPLHHFFLMI